MKRRQLQKRPSQSVPQQTLDPRRSQNPALIRDDVCYLYDLEIGDAGAGYRRNHKIIIFSQLFENAMGSTLNPMTKLYSMAQDPPNGAPIDQCRYRLFHVKFYGQSLIQMGAGGDTSFLPDRKDLSCGSSLPDQQVSTPLKGWIQTEDGMYQVFDILGRRYFEVYALHVQAGVLAPENSYAIGTKNRDGSQDIAYDGIVDQSCVGVAISQVVVNSAQIPDLVTKCVEIPATAGLAGTLVVPIPPGSRSVTISPDDSVVSVSFSWNPETSVFKGDSQVDMTAMLIADGQTLRLTIPGTPFMRLETAIGIGARVCLTFSQEL